MTAPTPVGPAPRPGAAALEPLEDPYDVRRALRADAALRPYNDAGLLEAADVHVAQRLGELGGEGDPAVRLAAALAVRAVRAGSTCVALEDARRLDPALPWPEPAAWAAAVAASPLVGPGRPLRWEDGLLYLERYWRQEVQVCADLLAREAQPPPAVDPQRLRTGLDRLFPAPTAQRVAAAAAATRWTTVLGGGPGTGKTTTVAGVLALLLDRPAHDPPLRVALAAPTGKAAARLQEALLEAADGLGFPAADRARLEGLTASTLHRLLGARPGTSTRFRHHRDATLPYDVVVVDETSMVSLTLMARLLEAVRPDTRLVLVGDPDQLASVEAGAVLADLVGGLRDRPPAAVAPCAADLVAGADVPHWRQGVVVLVTTHRYGEGIGRLADAVRRGDADAALAALRGGGEVSLVEDALAAPGVREDVVAAAGGLRGAAAAGRTGDALALLGRHRLLCAHRTGPYGVDVWARQVERWLAAADAAHGAGHGGAEEWYVGRPLLVTANDYALGLWNGDTGVVVRAPDGAARAAFARPGAPGGSVLLAPSRLHAVQTVHAMTVHRSQGSQFRRVTLVLPEEDSPLLTRELLYTAVTRAREHVRVVAGEAALRAAVERPAARASGLRRRLARG